MSFTGISLRFIRFLGPQKPPAEFTFTSGLNVLYGASDTGKPFLVEAIDFMLGSGEDLKDLPERQGYDRVLLGPGRVLNSPAAREVWPTRTIPS